MASEAHAARMVGWVADYTWINVAGLGEKLNCLEGRMYHIKDKLEAGTS